jgi:hypothetical protein
MFTVLRMYGVDSLIFSCLYIVKCYSFIFENPCLQACKSSSVSLIAENNGKCLHNLLDCKTGILCELHASCLSECPSEISIEILVIM